MILSDLRTPRPSIFSIGGIFASWEDVLKHLFLILGLIVCFGHGANADELLALEDDLHAEFSVIEEKMKKISPALVVSVANLPQMERAVKYQEYLVRRNFELFKSKIIMEFVIMAAVKGRKIKTLGKNNYAVDVDPGIFEDYVFGDVPNGHYFLDNGEFDSKKCKKKNKKLGWYQACEFPEGYERVVLDITSIEGEEGKDVHVKFLHDDAESNTTKIESLRVAAQNDGTKLMHFISEWDYREWLAEQNRFNSHYMKYGGWTEEYKEKLKKRRPEYYEALKAQAISEGNWDTPRNLGVEGGIISVFSMGDEDASPN